MQYVDDILIIWNQGDNELNNFLEHANQEHVNIKFTLEKEKNISIPFLDKLLHLWKLQNPFQNVQQTYQLRPICKRILTPPPKNLFYRVLSTTNKKYKKGDTDKLTDIFLKNNFKKDTISKFLNRIKNQNKFRKRHLTPKFPSPASREFQRP